MVRLGDAVVAVRCRRILRMDNGPSRSQGPNQRSPVEPAGKVPEKVMRLVLVLREVVAREAEQLRILIHVNLKRSSVLASSLSV